MSEDQYIIRRIGSQFALEWRCDIGSLFCGADRRWMDRLEEVVVGFLTFSGAEWYRSDWAIKEHARG